MSLWPWHLEQHFGDILDLCFSIRASLLCRFTAVVFCSSPLFTRVHSRSYDSTFDSNLHTPFTRTALSLSRQKGV